MKTNTLQATLTVLAVDDNPLNLMIIEEFLSDKYKVISVEAGEKALEMLEIQIPDLILLDVMMPGIDGIETCRLMRSRTELANVKIIMVSARGGTKDIAAGMSAGADHYLVKPFEQSKLLEIVGQVCR